MHVGKSMTLHLACLHYKPLCMAEEVAKGGNGRAKEMLLGYEHTETFLKVQCLTGHSRGSISEDHNRKAVGERGRVRPRN